MGVGSGCMASIVERGKVAARKAGFYMLRGREGQGANERSLEKTVHTGVCLPLSGRKAGKAVMCQRLRADELLSLLFQRHVRALRGEEE